MTEAASAPAEASDAKDSTIPPAELERLTADIIAALKSVYDPEIPVDVVNLGLIYECRIENGTEDGNHVYIKMTLTAAGCGMGPVITDDVKRKVEHVPNVDKVTVELTFDPPWNNDMLTDEAKLELGML